MDKNTLSWYELNDMTFEERCVVVRIELEGEKADDEFLIDMVEGIEDKDLLKYVLDNHFEGILSEEVLETIANEYSYYDTDFMKYLLENYHRDVDVSEDFIRAMIDRYDDADFTSYLLKNFYQISATEKETIAKYKEEEIKPDTEENDANKEVDEKDSAVGEETKQAQNLRQSEERTRPLTIYDNAILRFLAYIACGLLMLVRVAKCSSLMVIVGSCEYKLIDFLKRGSRYTKKPSKLPRYIRQLLIKLGIYAARLLVLGIITLTYSIMVIYIIVFALILQVIDLILSNYAEGQFGNYLDEIIWAVLLDA